MTPMERFHTKYVLNEWGCFVWQGEANAKGRCRFAVDGKKPVAYRWAWEQLHGPVPENRELDHFMYPKKCIGPGCANPEHVRPVTRRENNLRSENVGAHNRAKTHCPQNHEYTEENTHILPSGARRCRTCDNQHSRDYRARVVLKKN